VTGGANLFSIASRSIAAAKAVSMRPVGSVAERLT